MNILLTSVGRRAYMVQYFKEALDGHGKIHVANNVFTYAMQVSDEHVLTPLIYNDNYIDFLIEYCIKNDINAIVSLFDIDLPILAKNKHVFENNNIQLIVSDARFVQICNDKWLTYLFLKENGFKAPLTYVTLTDVLLAVDNGEIHFPLIIKPRWGMGSIGIFEAENKEELLVFYKKTMKSIQNSYLKYESIQDIENSIIIQEKLNGDEYGIDVFNDLNGKFLSCVPKKKLAMRAGETDSAEIVENDFLEIIAKNISAISGHIGNLDVDCFLVNGEFYILEMNCRFGGQYPFSHLAGVNYPKVICDLLRGKAIDEDTLVAKVGTIGVKDLIPVKLGYGK